MIWELKKSKTHQADTVDILLGLCALRKLLVLQGLESCMSRAGREALGGLSQCVNKLVCFALPVIFYKQPVLLGW